MLTNEIKNILESSQKEGWVLEPDAKKIFAQSGMDVPNFRVATTEEEAVAMASEIGYPVVAKIVSPKALHKSDVGGVKVGLKNEQEIKETFTAFSQFEGFTGLLIEEVVSGVEMIFGAKIDGQFGPVVLLGIGGTSVEIYQDTAIRMAPLRDVDGPSMIESLKAKKLLRGYRGADPIDEDRLCQMLSAFSTLVVDMADSIESIDLNPVMCTTDRCVIADARIILKS